MLFSPPAQDLVYCRGHKEKSFVSFSSDTIYACHPPFKVEAPPPLQEPRSWEGDRVTSALGILGTAGRWPGSLGGGGGADWPWQVPDSSACSLALFAVVPSDVPFSVRDMV